MRARRRERDYDAGEIVGRRQDGEDSGFLREMLETPGWRDVARASLRAQIDHLKERIATDQRMTPEDWRTVQAEIRLLNKMLKEPFAFFSIPR